MRNLLPLVLLAVTACTSVDVTEDCILTRYGKVVEEKMDIGLNFTPFTHATCFKMTEQNFPNGDANAKEIIEAQTHDPITVSGELAIVYKFDPATIMPVFLEKRSQENAEIEILNSIRTGYRDALSKWTITEIFDNRAALSDSVRVAIQRKIGTKAIITNVFVRNIAMPPAIDSARVQATVQTQVLDKAQKQLAIATANAAAAVAAAEGASKAKQLEAQSYATNPKLLDLEIAKQYSAAFATACHGVSTCVIGGSVMDAFMGGTKK